MCYIACSCKQYNTSERKLQDFASGDFGGEENQALVKRSEIGSHPDTAETGVPTFQRSSCLLINASSARNMARSLAFRSADAIFTPHAIEPAAAVLAWPDA